MKMFHRKYIILIVACVILFFLIYYLLIYTKVHSNDKYIDSIKSNITNKYKKINIDYVNEYGGYYIVVSNNNIIVLDFDYNEIIKDSVSNIKLNKFDIVYKTNKIMYEETVLKNNKLIYNYYDIDSGKFMDSVILR